MPSTTRLSVRFGDCDLAGIVYYPRLFHFLHVAFEDFFATCVKVKYRDVLQRVAFPAVHVEADFRAPLPYGCDVLVTCRVYRVGSSSAEFSFDARRDDGARAFAARIVVVAVDPRTLRPIPLPDDVRQAFEADHKASRPQLASDRTD
jgi:4-hydroxybenzoyl-CoA thioesterase